jgi:hypothetical protein
MFFVFLFIIVCSVNYGQQDEKLSTIEFVQIVNNNKEEALFYYQNNWKVLRNMAVKKGCIESYQLLETVATDTEPFDLMLITTYRNEAQYEKREAHFAELMKEKGPVELLNDKKPGEFRKTVFAKERVRHRE